MSTSFSTEELIKVAIVIEKQGIAYYDVMAISTWHEAASDLFQHLVAWERQHLEIFQNMLAESGNYKLPEKGSNSHEAYMRALINNAVFTDELAASELATHIDSEDGTLDIAISAEKDSILFYYNLNEILPLPADPVIRQILNEEKLHLSQLSELRQKMLSLK